MESLPTTMRAWTHNKPGEPEDVLFLRSDFPVATPTPTEVLVKISHAALNPGAGIFLRLLPMFLRGKPTIPEMDFAGTICHVGADVPADRGLAIGTQIFGNVPVIQHIKAGRGALAEYVAVEAGMVCIKPENISLDQAAGLGIAAVSGLVLIDAAKLEKGQKVLINGASGGVGACTLQMIKDAIGEEGKVVAICSKRKIAMVKELGADEIIDYQEHAPVQSYLAEEYKNDKFDMVIDAVGIQDLYANSPSYLKSGKPYVTIGIQPKSKKISWGALFSMVGQMMSNMMWPRFLGGIDRPYIQVAARADLVYMERVATMIRDGKLKASVDHIWEMKDVVKAYERLASGSAKGKVIVDVQSQ